MRNSRRYHLSFIPCHFIRSPIRLRAISVILVPDLALADCARVLKIQNGGHKTLNRCEGSLCIRDNFVQQTLSVVPTDLPKDLFSCKIHQGKIAKTYRVLVANLATNFWILVARAVILVALATVLGAISCPVMKPWFLKPIICTNVLQTKQ